MTTIAKVLEFAIYGQILIPILMFIFFVIVAIIVTTISDIFKHIINKTKEAIGGKKKCG